MNQSDLTLHYHLHSMRTLFDLVWPQPLPPLGGVGGTRQQDEYDPTREYTSTSATERDYDPNAQAERVELRCPICGRQHCLLDVRRRM